MSHFYLVRPSIREIKEKKRKRNINNDLVDLPSHDTIPLLGFLVPRNFSSTICNMGWPCRPSCLCLLLSTLLLLIFLPRFLLPLGSSSLSLFLLASCSSITSNSFLIFPNIPDHTSCPTTHIVSLPWTSLGVLFIKTSLLCALVTPYLPCLADTLSRTLRLLLWHSLSSPFLPRYPTLP